MDQKLNRIYVYTEAMTRVEKILEPLWNEYMLEQSMSKKKTIWVVIEQLENIQNNLNDKYLKTS